MGRKPLSGNDFVTVCPKFLAQPLAPGKPSDARPANS